jgi:hypothetical protein
MIKRVPKIVGGLLAEKFAKKLHERSMHIPAAKGSLEINLVTSWNEQCGIATYSAFLSEELKKNAKLYIACLTKKNALNPYYLILGYKVGRSQDLVHVQFE